MKGAAVLFGNKSKLDSPFAQWMRKNGADVQHVSDDTQEAEQTRAMLRGVICAAMEADELGITPEERTEVIRDLLAMFGGCPEG